MNNSRILLLVDIDDSMAIRKKKLQDSSASEDFYFLLPPEYKEYDPLTFIYFFDDSIINLENYYSRLPEDQDCFSLDFGQKIIIEFLNHYNIILFCKGSLFKDNRRKFLEEICEMYPHFELIENRKFDFQYDDKDEIHSFEDFFQSYLETIRCN